MGVAAIRKNSLKNDKSLWEEYYNKGYIYSISPSQGAIECISYLHRSNKKVDLIIDVGCGYGRDLKAFYQSGVFNNIVGIDISSTAIKKGKSLLKSELKSGHVRLINCDVFDCLSYEILKERGTVVVYTHYFLQILNKTQRNDFFKLILNTFKNKDLLILNEYAWENPRRKNLIATEEERTYILYSNNPNHKVHFFKKEEFYIPGFNLSHIYQYIERETIINNVFESVNWFVVLKKEED